MGEHTSARRIDLAIAGGLLVVGQVELSLQAVTGSMEAARLVWAAAAVAALVRRGHPLLFFCWALALFGWTPIPGLAAPAIWALYLPLALFGLGAYVRDARHAALAAGGGVALAVALRTVLFATGELGLPLSVSTVLPDVVVLAPAAAAGLLLRDRTEVLRTARRRAERAAAAEGVDVALADERARIARELHAVVRGCVRAVLDDVAAARAALAMRSGAAHAALRRAAGASQQAMAEMRRMLLLLRGEPAGGEADGGEADGGWTGARMPAAADDGAAAVGGVGRGRPDAADVPATLDDLVAHRRGLRRTVDVRGATGGAPRGDGRLPAVAMRVLVALAELPGSTRMTVERGDGVVRASARVAGPRGPARVEALSERARLAGGRLRRGRLRRSRLRVTLPADASAAAQPSYRPAWLSLPAGVREQGLPLLLLALELSEALLVPLPALHGASTVERVAGALLVSAAFLPRRRWPLATVFAVVAVAAARMVVADDLYGLYPALYFAGFAAGAYVRPTWLAVACVLVPFAGGWFAITEALGGYPFSGWTYAGTLLGAAWLTGLGGRRRLAEADELRELTTAEERRQERAIARAVDAERLRVARELHDLVGHGLTAITLQCAAAERLLEREPAAATAAIGTVEEVGREVLRELRQLLAALDGGGERELPQLARLPELAKRAEGEGLRVELALVGDLAAVPAGHAGAGYRIVQEGLTNARKHGRPGVVRVRVANERGRLRIEVRNADGAGAGAAAGAPAVQAAAAADPLAAGAPGSRLGLAGMRERVRVYDGWLSAGPDGEGGWVVRAELPLAR
jgi:signal transduction histidine kinase